MDKTEEKEKLAEGEKLRNLVKSDGWAIFKERYEDVILSLADIRNIPFELRKEGKDPVPLPAEQRTYEMQIRERTLFYMQKIMSGLLGDIEEFEEMLNGTRNKEVDEDFIIRFDN